MIGIVDYNAGNITSVERALKSLGFSFVASKNPIDLEKADKIIFPGVGDAHYAMEQLKLNGFDKFLKDCVQTEKKIMGICLGSQIIFDYSEEGDTECLGLVKGCVRYIEKAGDLKVPHIGWNNLEYQNGNSPLLQNIDKNANFYFVHSYYICPDDYSVVKATTDYGIKIPAVIEKDNISAFQFHPEKSGKAGLQILKNFCEGEKNLC